MVCRYRNLSGVFIIVFPFSTYPSHAIMIARILIIPITVYTDVVSIVCRARGKVSEG
jgi:bifunctional DNase/RNase